MELQIFKNEQFGEVRTADILEEQVDERYFLSEEATRKLTLTSQEE